MQIVIEDLGAHVAPQRWNSNESNKKYYVRNDVGSFIENYDFLWQEQFSSE